MIHTHQTAPTQFVEANGIRFAYRRFGKTGGVPIVFNQHYIGTIHYWDPTVTDGLARDREVILFNNAGVSSSSGEVRRRSSGWAGTPENKTALVTGVPMGRLDLSEELANAIVFIASDKASFITGHVLNVDGGHTAN